MNYILDYETLNEKLKKLTNLKKEDTVKTRFGYEIPYYTYGNGNKNIVVVGGTHGSEIISVDFVLTLMDYISNKKDIFKDFDITDYKFHFIPVQNPEGFIVSTSVIRTKIPKNMNIKDMEKICKEYYTKYRQDDINVKENPSDKSLKLHQEMFSNATYECISDNHRKLKDNIKKIFENDTIPKGSIIMYRPNGSGVELNRNTIFNQGIKDIKNNKITYGNRRYNNIPKNIPGPIGIPCLDVSNFEYEIENIFLHNLLDKLYVENKLYCCILYHGTGGEIYHEPIFDVFDSKLAPSIRKEYESINLKFALKYQKFTDYRLASNKDDKLESFDGYLRTVYPGIVLIELSKMGGNPIGPYGDINNNYVPTINDNLKAFKNLLY